MTKYLEIFRRLIVFFIWASGGFVAAILIGSFMVDGRFGTLYLSSVVMVCSWVIVKLVDWLFLKLKQRHSD